MIQKYLTFFDTETTGLKDPEVAEFAFIVVDQNLQEIDSQVVLCQPSKPIEPGAEAVHGISNEDVAGQPSLREHFEMHPEWRDYFYGTTLAGHNIISYDIPIIKKTLDLGHVSALDTLRLARALVKKTDCGNHKLQTLVHFFELPRREAHRALSDVESCIDLVEYFIKQGSTLQDLYDAANNNMGNKKKALLSMLH